ncbi:MAG: fused MFS/spermidine synthase, partial [Actinomycetota bacterium]|nr:fused MFS/spermidine synthase [Actinomycetota bacterium]
MPVPTTTEVLFGTAELLPDADRRHGWFLAVGGVPQSYLQLDDPTHLEFEYVRLIGDLVDLVGLPDEPLTVLHLGGGGCTVARYVAATRPGSTQLVIEVDAALAELVRRELGTAGFTLRVGEARQVLPGLADDSSDIVVADVFAGADLPRHLTTTEFLVEVRRVLRPGGTYVANVADGGGLGFVRGQVATLRATFAHAVLL